MLSSNLQVMTQWQRSTWIQAVGPLNTSLDHVFYDVDSLTSQERLGLSARTNPEGSVLIIYPKDDGQEITQLTPLQFISSQIDSQANAIDAMVVAGVGSSALGSAALARNVADYLNRPVAALVSGLGVADVISEGLGGWFVLGSRNRLRDSFAKLRDIVNFKDHDWDDASYRTLVKHKEIKEFDLESFVYSSPDSAALLLILYHLGKRINLLVGHSKGNYVIENGLRGLITLCGLKQQSLPDHIQIVTLGAVLRFPDQFINVSQFIGEIDYFGMLNSRPNLESVKISGSWHSLNSRLPGHLPVGKALKLANVQ